MTVTLTAKTSTFAGQLKHFAQTIDIVDTNTFDQVRELVCEYVTNELSSDYFELLRRETDDNAGSSKLWLQTFWSSEDKSHLWSIRTDGGDYTNPVTDAFDNARPMWVVSAEGRCPLDQTDEYVDMWSGIKIHSKYNSASGLSIRTLIVLPLSFRHLVVGVLCIESMQYIGITDVARWELLRLANSLAILYTLWDSHRAQSACKDRAINDLRFLLTRARFPRLAKPHFFLASSKSADETVMLIIKGVLKKHSDKLEYTDWGRMTSSGNIMSQISKEIMESRFGICYLSESVESIDATQQRYKDNPNVVFEAGMLHARTTAAAEDKDENGPSGWIPIREENSPPPPFDFSAERILYIPRVNGEINESKLQEMLEVRILKLLGVD